MAFTKLTILALAAVSAALPEPMAEVVPQLARRAPYAGGGFALVTANTCPAGYQTLYDVTLNVCCPPNTEQTGSSGPSARSCCPKNTGCTSALLSDPFCADSTWVLWNATSQAAEGDNYNTGLFCCLPGQTGTQNWECADALTNVAATLSAAKIGQPVPTGPAGVTISVGATGTVTGTTATVSVAGSTTTSHQGIVGAVSSLIHGSTGVPTYPRSPIAPASKSGFAWVGMGAWAVGVATFALFAIRA